MAASTVAQADAMGPPEAGLISRNEALADIDKLCAVLLTHGAQQVGAMVDFPRLQARAIAGLEAKGVQHVECKTGVTPRLIIHIEALRLPGTRLCVYRVQTALSRIVTFTDHRELRVQADVWRLKPVMAAVPEADVADAIGTAVLTQVEVFAGAYQAARAQRLPRSPGDTGQAPPSPQTAPQPTPGRDAVAGPFVASKSSSVFHRSECRWVRNIAARNRVTYATRAEAVQAGKRPCKTCKP
jgi:hypothetical protein